MRDWLRLNIIYDAAVGLRYGSSATTLDVLVPHSVRTMAAEPLQKRSVSNSGSGTFKAPTILFKIVVHRPKTNFLQQLSSKIRATFSEF